MKSKTKMILCILGIILSTQIQWIIPKLELLNGIGFLFAIGFGWYARDSQSNEETKKFKSWIGKEPGKRKKEVKR